MGTRSAVGESRADVVCERQGVIAAEADGIRPREPLSRVMETLRDRWGDLPATKAAARELLDSENEFRMAVVRSVCECPEAVQGLRQILTGNVQALGELLEVWADALETGGPELLEEFVEQAWTRTGARQLVGLLSDAFIELSWH